MRPGLPSCIVVGTLLAAGASAAAEQAADTFIPSFVDPTSTIDTPAIEPGTTLRFVTGDDYPPFDFTRPDGMLTGFNVDLARALCEDLKVTCTVQARPWASLIPAVVTHEADAAIASLSITDQAQRSVAFTHPYYRTPARFIARTGAAGEPTPASLAGRKVGVKAGTAQAAYLRTFFPAALATPFPTIEAARLALKAGEIEAVFDDGVGAAVWLNSDAAAGCCAFRGGAYTESRFFGPGAGIAVRKDDGTLLRALDAALVRITASGRFGDIYLRYFPVGFY